MEELLTRPGAFKCKVSSTLNSSLLYAAKHMFDENQDTCWNSDQGSPQYIALDFGRPVEITSIKVAFQGGFVGQDCILEVGDTLSTLSKLTDVHSIQDINDLQSVSIPVQQAQKVCKFVFNSSTDFYGRVTIYRFEVYGRYV